LITQVENLGNVPLDFTPTANLAGQQKSPHHSVLVMLIKNPRFKHWINLICSFLAGQGSVQVLNLVTGFFLLRWMSIDDFAQLSVVLGFQSTVGILVDVGFSGSITALVGDRFQDKGVVGTYVRSAQEFRNQSFIVIIPLAGIAFYLIAVKHNWSLPEQIILFSSIIASLFFQGWVGYYSSSLLMNRQVDDFYKPQMVGSLGRLVLCYALHISSVLSAWNNAWISTATIAINGFYYRYNSAKYLIKPDKENPTVSKEMFRYISPLIPGIVFTAFQGQISLFIITFFGQTKSIAEVAALGRLGQIFVLLGAFNGIIIEPYISQVSRKILPLRYFQILAGGIFIASVICMIGFIFPQPLLWLLGSKYQNLEVEVGWVVAGACISYVGGVIFTMNSARKWIYWWVSFTYITTLLATQLVCLATIDLTTTMGVIYFSVISAISIVFVHIANSVFGFTHGSKI
jgi:O-antigen/teichoic acid export membrane protein